MSENKILKAVSAWAPLLSAIALATLTIFNIGYFSKIGIHFLGVVDFSNVVYSFGLFFGIIGMLFVLVGFDSFDYAKGPINFEKLYPFSLGFKVVAVLLLCIALVGLVFGWPYIRTDAFVSFASFVTAVAAGLHGFVRWRATQKILPSDYLTSVAVAFLCIIFAGRAVAELQITSPSTYDITTKDTSLADVRIVRSSSMGFLIAEGRNISFIPSGELKKIRATKASE